jgi:putative PIN family toxin of toxin-antitoxin system
MRVILDTNVFVSMALGGRVGKINSLWKRGKFTLIASDAILSEYIDVLSRSKLHLNAESVSIVITRVQRKADFVNPSETIDAVKDDSADNKFLEAALEGKADCVITGDRHLLKLKIFRGIPILTAEQFIHQLENSG